uniref:VOC domain-containing protein n=1 Tax=Plectus sambesii TaxID=2011161 RepID=A0A914VYN5_9BILA
MATRKPEPRVTLISLSVNDLKASTKFYHEGLGWALSPRSDDELSFFELKNIWIALFPKTAFATDVKTELHNGNTAKLSAQEAQNQPFNGIALAHNVCSEAEVDEIMNIAEKAGGKIVSAAEKKFWGGYSGYFRDLDGHFWEVAYDPLSPP